MKYRVRYYDPRKKGTQAAIFRSREDAEAFASCHRIYARPCRVEDVPDEPAEAFEDLKGRLARFGSGGS